MNIFKLSFKNITKKMFFSVSSFIIAGTLLFFTLFYLSSIEASVSKSIPLNIGEYNSYVDENRFTEIPINFYQRLKEEFDVVIPYVYELGSISTENDCVIIGTDIETNKLYYNNKFYNYTIRPENDLDCTGPFVFLSENLKETVSNNQISVNGKSLFVIGYISFTNDIIDENIVLTSLEIFGNYINDSIINEESGISKYIINSYYIKSNKKEADVLNIISMIYNSPDSRYYIDSYEKMFDLKMNEFMIFSNVSIAFFALVSIFSFFNILISINLSIEERKKMYSLFAMLGMKLNHLRKIIYIEMFIVCLISTIVSIIAGFMISIITISVSSSLSFEMIPLFKFIFALIATMFIPMIHVIISTCFIKYKQII